MSEHNWQHQDDKTVPTVLNIFLPEDKKAILDKISNDNWIYVRGVIQNVVIDLVNDFDAWEKNQVTEVVMMPKV